MNPQHVDQPHDLTIIGLAIRTGADSAARDIPGHWQRFLGEGLPGRLPSSDGAIYAVYCDYQADHRAPYTMVLGVAVAADADVGPGLRRVRVPAGRYASVIAEGPPAEAVWRAWSWINEAWPERARRRYIADLERYAPGAMAPDRVIAELRVGVD
jgi:predicted transcriptional regulator YdeE